MKTVYIAFEANPGNEYAYHAGALHPVPGQSVVILVGKEPDKRKKLVQCVRTSDEVDPRSTATIFGIVQEQPQEQK